MSKDLWFAEFERLYNEALDDGVPDSRAYDQAADKAHGAMIDRLADMADQERKRRKGE